MKKIIATKEAPEAIGSYSQAVQVGNLLYFSGQVGLEPNSMQLVEGGCTEQLAQIWRNITAVASAAGATLNDCVKLTVYLTDLGDFQQVNSSMAEHFQQPYPARAAIEVSALPKNACVEVEGIIGLTEACLTKVSKETLNRFANFFI